MSDLSIVYKLCFIIYELETPSEYFPVLNIRHIISIHLGNPDDSTELKMSISFRVSKYSMSMMGIDIALNFKRQQTSKTLNCCSLGLAFVLSLFLSLCAVWCLTSPHGVTENSNYLFYLKKNIYFWWIFCIFL